MILLDLEGLRIEVSRWILYLKTLECFDEDIGDDEITVPFAIGRDDIPRSVLCARLLQDIGEDLHEFRPFGSILEIAGIEFPILLGIIEPGLEALLLFFVGDVQEEFKNSGAFVDEEALEIVDVLVAL